MKNEVKALAQQYPKIQSLMRYVNKETLLEAYEKQPNSNMKHRYGNRVDENINVLLRRMKQSSYFPQSQHGYSKLSSDEWNLKHEFKVFEDKIVADVLKKILMSIYEVKGCVTFSSGLNEPKVTVNSRHRRLLLPILCEINLSGPISNADKEELITFLGENIADRKFMQFIKRFLHSGILKRGNISEKDSRDLLASMLLRIFIYHSLRDRLISGRTEVGCKMKLWVRKGIYIFATQDSGDLFRLEQMLLNMGNEYGLKIDITMPKAYQNRRKTMHPVKRRREYVLDEEIVLELLY